MDAWPIALWLVACTPAISDYQVTLVPHFVGDTDSELFAKNAEVKLIITDPEGARDVVDLGAAEEGVALTAPALGPLAAGTALGLAFEAPGAAAEDEWDRVGTLAYGEVVLAEDLALGGAERTLDLVPLWVDRATRLGRFGDGASRLGGAPAITADGTIYVFGGGDSDGLYAGEEYAMLGVASDRVTKVPRELDGWGPEQTLALRLPEQDVGNGPTGNLAHAVAITADTARGERIFILGGRESVVDTRFHSDRWLEFDPAAEAFVDEGEMFLERSSFLALPIGANKVLLYGGYGGMGVPYTTTYELFSTASGGTELGAHIDELWGNYGAFGTPYGKDAVVCTGARLDPSVDGAPLEPGAQCVVISGANDLRTIADLPAPLFAASIAALPDGGLLVTGGAAEALDELDGDDARPAVADALATAYRYDASTNVWTRTAGDLITARANHRSVALADGRVLIIGGSGLAGYPIAASGVEITSTEIYDPRLDRFEISGDEGSIGGLNPPIGGRPGGPWVVLEGEYAESAGDPSLGGDAFGVIGGQPE